MIAERIIAKKIPSLRHVMPSAVLSLAAYITIYSLPNIVGMSSTVQPVFFGMWQFVSLLVILIVALIVSLARKTLGTEYLTFFVLTGFSTILTYALTTESTELKHLFSALIPVVVMGAYYVISARYKLSPDSFKKLSLYFVYFIVFASIYNVAINAGNILNFAAISDPYQYNFQSFFENRNAFSQLLALGLVLVVFLRHVNKVNATWFVVILALFTGNLVMTLSRGGMLFALLAILLFYFFYGKPKKLISYLVAVSLTAVLMLNFLGGGFVEDNIIRPEAGSTHRDSIQEYAMDFYTEHNVWIGSGESIRPYLRDEYGLTSVHNTYIDVLVTGGILKMIIYATLAVVLVFAGRIIKRQNRAIGSLFLALMATYLLYSFLETATPFLLSPTSAAITVFIFIAPLYIYNYYHSKNASRSSQVYKK